MADREGKSPVNKPDMQLSKKSEVVTKQMILDRVGAEVIYRAELGDVKVGRSFCNSMRKDKNPSLSIYIGDDGHWRHHDHADDRYKGCCIDLVCQKYNISWREAIERLSKQYGLSDGIYVPKTAEVAENRQIEAQKRHCLIQVTTCRWNKWLLDYWADYGIEKEDLRNDDVFPVREWFLNRQKQSISITERCYAYKYDKGFQILMPDRDKSLKWKTNMPLSYIDGWDSVNGCEKVLITKAKKDKLYLQKLLPFPVIRTMNESISAFTPEVVEKLRGKQVWVNFDTDTAGKRASWKVTELLKCKHLNVPDRLLDEKITDFTDWRKLRGSDEEIVQFLRQKKLLD